MTAIVSGTFDPITVGHVSLIERAQKLFGSVVVAVCTSHYKTESLTGEVRLEAVKAAVKGMEGVKAEICDGLLVEFCEKYDDPVIVRGVRSTADFDYETDMYKLNKRLSGIETVFIPSESGREFISSTFARELIKYGRDLEGIVPEGAAKVLEKHADVK